jgi:hypothetical protein
MKERALGFVGWVQVPFSDTQLPTDIAVQGC